MMFVYMHRGARIVLPEAVNVQQTGEEIYFIDRAGKTVAQFLTTDVWLSADHDLMDDIEPSLIEDVEPTIPGPNSGKS